MSADFEETSMEEQFLEVVQSDDVLRIKEFLNHQNISDVAELINNYPDYESQIVANMSVHRAAKVFKILDLPTQKNIIHELEQLEDFNAQSLAAEMKKLNP